MPPENSPSKPRGLYDFSVEKDACGFGLVVQGKSEARHSVLQNGLDILRRLAHRGACGADGKSGDGAGILLQIPDSFFRQQSGLDSLPLPGRYAVASVFLPKNSDEQEAMRLKFAALASKFALPFLGQRKVCVNSSVLGAQARLWEPSVWQWIVGWPDSEIFNESDFQKRLFLLRRSAEKELRPQISSRDPTSGRPISQFYVASLSNRTLVYKGLLLPEDLDAYYSDLKNPEFKSAFALVHSRFSTNTLPSWELAHPYRYLCHNGEINTLRGNLHWLKARETQAAASLSPENPSALLPLIGSGQSDSQSLDNLVELLVQGGRSLPHSLMMAVPEVWESLPDLSDERKAFNAFHSLRLEPWDGPAALGFSDGKWVGACLDRNGLRPCRYQILSDGTLVLASEAGALDTNPAQVVKRGRLRPGELLAFNLEEGRLYGNDELRQALASAEPYGKWVKAEQAPLSPLEDILTPADESEPLPTLLRRFGYTSEEVSRVLLPMLRKGEEATSSMGNDTPLAVLSDHPQLLFRYFRQLFAQVTNPPIDPERERVVMSLTTLLGPRAPLLSVKTDNKRRIRLSAPILSRATFSRLLAPHLGAKQLPILFSATNPDLEDKLKELCERSAIAVRNGCSLLILSDRGTSSEMAAIPSLLALSAVHHHLIRCGLRTETSLVVDTAEARDTHHFACLIGFGADAIHPRLISILASHLQKEGELSCDSTSIDPEALFLAASEKGLLKIMSKLGISTLPSYCGGQNFEILGLSREVTEQFFPSTPAPIGGMDLRTLAQEALRRHRAKEQEVQSGNLLSRLPLGGEIHYRNSGETHFWNPVTIAKLQFATRQNDARSYEEFRESVERLSRFTLRGLLELKPLRAPIPLEQVEPATQIMRRFSTGAMSFGALGKEAHEALAIAMNRIGAKSNSGEGGEDSARFLPELNGDEKNSAIKQVASGRFGVTSHYLANARELQIKIAQGAKPGEGGQLPGHKVDSVIARLRHSTPGVSLISPPPHHDIYSIEDLAQLIFDLKNANPRAAVSVKLVAEAGIGTIAAGVAKAHADKIVISGDSGGTGASPLSSIKNAGAPWELGLAEAQQALVANGLRGRVRLETDGQLKTGKDVMIAALLGADEYGFSTAPLIVEGCVMMRKCHLNTCPVGVATQDPELRAKFQGKPEYLIRYFHFVAEEVRGLLSQLGFRSMEEAVGRSDCLAAVPPTAHEKAHHLDLTRLLAQSESRIPGVATERHFIRSADFRLEDVLDQELVKLCHAAIERKKPVQLERTISSGDRSVGALLSYHVSRRQGAFALAPDTIRIEFQGTAGQSFGAFLAAGISFSLEGEANDYVGKGLSGGSLRIFGPRDSGTSLEVPVLAGNTCLYGATSGEFFLAGAAGERFAVRNSGAIAVVEAVGDHGCEYMTGGRVVVLGEVGKNFAAGMSGGLAFVFDPHKRLPSLCNPGSVALEPVDEKEDIAFLHHVIQRHQQLTGSPFAAKLLSEWRVALPYFVRVMPLEYKKVLAAQRSSETTKELAPPSAPLAPTKEAILFG